MTSEPTAGPALLAAIGVFRDLGWPRLPVEDAVTGPIGTAAQQATALKGLRSGNWRDVHELWDDPASGLQGGAAWDTLALFAVRVGVAAPRAVTVLSEMSFAPAQVMADVVATRGPEFAAAFVAKAQRGARWLAVDPAVLRSLVVRFDLPVPRNQQYLVSWFRVAAHELRSGLGTTKPRFSDHVEAGISSQIEAHDLAAVLADGVRSGRLPRDRGLELALGALDAASRTSDRTGWARSLADDLAITGAEVAERAELLVQAMAIGPAAVVDLFAPRLIAIVDDVTLVDVLGVALAATTKKTLRAVLAATAARPRPATAEQAADLVAEHAGSGDRTIARAAQAVLDAWGSTAEPIPDEPVVERGLWQPTPPVWQVPDLELPPATPEAVLESLGTLMRRPEGAFPDIDDERFLALAQRLAHTDPALARETLSALPEYHPSVIESVRRWVAADPDTVDPGSDPQQARDQEVSSRLDTVPCVLSTPTRVDLRISPSDVAARLAAYAAAGLEVGAADLALARSRVDATEPSEQDLNFDLHVAAGLRFRQLVRRESPLPTPLANRLLEAQHTARPGAFHDLRAALVEAWQRGLLPPGTITVGSHPTAIAATSAVLLDVSEDGLAALAWDVLDQLTIAAAGARSVPPGTLEAIEALTRLLPEARAAVATGIAEPGVLELRGVRDLARRPGSGRAIVAARDLVRELPTTAADAAAEPSPTIDLSELWPIPSPADAALGAVKDGATITAAVATDRWGRRMTVVDVTLAELPDQTLRVWFPWIWQAVNGTPYREHDPATDQSEPEDWHFEWDSDAKRYVVAPFSVRLPRVRSSSPRPVAITAIALAGVLGNSSAWERQQLTGIIASPAVNAPTVRLAVRALLASEINPTRLVLMMEKDKTLIATLWPVLTESVRYAGSLADQVPLPRWVSGVLGAAIGLAPILVEAARTARIPAQDAAWPGLRTIAERAGSTAAVKRATLLLNVLDPTVADEENP